MVKAMIEGMRGDGTEGCREDCKRDGRVDRRRVNGIELNVRRGTRQEGCAEGGCKEGWKGERSLPGEPH